MKLSNGKIVFKLEDLQDDEKDALDKVRLISISKRFISNTSKESNTADPKENFKNEAASSKNKSPIRKTILVVIIIGIVGIAAILFNKNNISSANSSETYHEQVMSVEEIERSEPKTFLTASGTYKENFLGNKIKVNCVITNKATVASYKDAIIRVTYYSKTKTNLGSNDYTIYENFPPSSTKTVQLKIENYKDVSSIGWDVIDAVSN